MPEALIESLDHEGRGVAHVDEKVIFIEGALPGERVVYESYHRKPRYEQAYATAVLRESSQRVTPRCPHFGVCGGCSMQHLSVSAQVAATERCCMLQPPQTPKCEHCGVTRWLDSRNTTVAYACS